MQVVNTVAELRRALVGRPRPTLVPTMGNLHAGHLSLVELARRRGNPVVTSIFVNRLQFAPHEDFDRYPRSLERDCELLTQAGCDWVFAPSEEEMYPEPQSFTVQPPSPLADSLEGAVRPGFFTGVCTVVLKLCCMVEPAVLVLGKKDYQQWLVLRQMIRQFALPIEVLAGDIIRDSDGLALSSRNAYLDEHLRVTARQLFAVLRNLAAAARGGDDNWARLERSALGSLKLRGCQPDYVTVRRQWDLGEPTSGPLMVLGAARVGGTRLIDNLEL